MAKLQSWRKAYGALKDTTTVGLAHVNSDYKVLDVAIVKATNHVEGPPKERHLRKILAATSATRAPADVSYCVHALARRLAKTHNWKVALKTLIVIHRTLRMGDPTFREELLNYSKRGHIFQLSNFKDDSSPIAWDCSGWVRTYALFLDERLECFRSLKYDIEAELLPGEEEQEYSRTRYLDSEALLEQMQALQKLLFRLIGCRPEGAAIGNYVIQYAVALVLKESFKIYCALNDGIINLVNKFFEMPKREAIKSLEVYRRAGQQARGLSDFYDLCKGLELARNFQFPVLKEPPQSFLATMDEYIREAPRGAPAREPLEFQERLSYKKEVPSSSEEAQLSSADNIAVSNVEATLGVPSQNNLETVDFLGLNVSAPYTTAIERCYALALAIASSDATSSSGSGSAQAKDFDPAGWEVALVTTPSNNDSSVNYRKLAGGLDSLTLNSLYDEGAYRAAQQPKYGAPPPDQFGGRDPFALSTTIAPAPLVQMAAMPQPHGFPFGLSQPSYPLQHQQQQQQQQHLTMGSGYTDLGAVPMNSNPAVHSHTNNPFGSTGFL